MSILCQELGWGCSVAEARACDRAALSLDEDDGGVAGAGETEAESECIDHRVVCHDRMLPSEKPRVCDIE